MNNILDQLNDRQREAVLNIDGALLVLAGAGSGKTRVITHRFAYILQEKNLALRNILAVTFTNKAANEMKERIGGLVGFDTRFAWVRTFHSTGLMIIRSKPELIGYPSSFVIYDDTDSKNIVTTIMKDMGINIKDFLPKTIYGAISKAKDNLVSVSEYTESADSQFDDIVAKVFIAYQNMLRKNKAVDFADLISLPITMFLENRSFLDEYREMWQYIMVDEFQDTNKAQYKLLKLITGKANNICVVGDDDQSIYGWRGARIDNIYDFKDRYKADVIALEQNYRSTNIILKAANSVVSKITGRMSKKLWTDRDSEEKIKLIETPRDIEEAKTIAENIAELSDKYAYSEFAIFYRTNAQSRLLEEALLRRKIPYKIFGGQKFYARKEIKDILAYIRLIINPYDYASYSRIVNVPSRKIGGVSMQKISNYADVSGISYIEALLKIDQAGVNKSLIVKAQDLGQILLELNQSVEGFTPMNFVKLLLETIGYKAYIEKYDEDGRDRWSNVEELINSVKNFQDTNPELNIVDFLNEVSLQTGIDEMGEDRNYVSLMTIHNAKGLEFSVVFVSGVVDGLMPHFASLTSKKEMDEERRLFYVAITRAKDILYLCHSQSRMKFGEVTMSTPSPFLKDIPDELTEIIVVKDTRPMLRFGNKDNSGSYKKGSGGYGKYRGKSYTNSHSPKSKTKSKDTKIELHPASKSEYKTSAIESMDTLNVGDRVLHNIFGVGTVEFVSAKMLKAEFDEYGTQVLGGNLTSSIKKIEE